jgi:hypothetical protein
MNAAFQNDMTSYKVGNSVDLQSLVVFLPLPRYKYL